MDEVCVGVGGCEVMEASSSVEGVNVDHHGSIAMDGGPNVGEEFLCPSAEHMAGTVIGRNGLDGVAVADPPEVASPEVGGDDAEGPTACSDFANEGVVVLFGSGAAARGGKDGLETGRLKGFVEGDRRWVVLGEHCRGGNGGGAVFGLHEDEGHAGFGPVGFDEGGEGAIVSSEEWVGQ